MLKRRNAIMTAAITVASSFGAGSLLAQEENKQESTEGQGMHGDMMQEGGMHGMMGMMDDMNDMMEKCNAMMEKMQQGQENDTNA
jgi:hypothetical protein